MDIVNSRYARTPLFITTLAWFDVVMLAVGCGPKQLGQNIFLRSRSNRIRLPIHCINRIVIAISLVSKICVLFFLLLGFVFIFFSFKVVYWLVFFVVFIYSIIFLMFLLFFQEPEWFPACSILQIQQFLWKYSGLLQPSVQSSALTLTGIWLFLVASQT